MSELPKVMLGGPMFEPEKTDYWRSIFQKEGAHYNQFEAVSGSEMDGLRSIFPEGEANELNFALFSTSGVHGTYNTIEEAEKHLEDPANDQLSGHVTFVVIQPRICCLRYGNCTPQNANDISFLKRLRESSWNAVRKIGE